MYLVVDIVTLMTAFRYKICVPGLCGKVTGLCACVVNRWWGIETCEDEAAIFACKLFRFDRTLGGKIFQSRLANHLAKEFTKMKKTPNSVYDSPRALQKLHKEAGRLKNVLSANTEHFAQVCSKIVLFENR